MCKNDSIEYLIQTLDETLPPMRTDLEDNFQAVAAYNIKYFIEEFPDKASSDPKVHYVIFALDHGEAVSYVYFWIEGQQTIVFGAFTSKEFRQRGLSKVLFESIFLSKVNASTTQFNIHFDRDVTEERIGLNRSIKNWFVSYGPPEKRLKIYFPKNNELIISEKS